MDACRSRGFTLVELMIVVVIIGVLAAIAIPNFISITKRAQEATVKANLHTVQVAMEDFAVQNDSFYPTSGLDATPGGVTLSGVCPSGDYPRNPFTKLASVVQWNSNPSAGLPGELAVNPAEVNRYALKGNGPAGDTLSLVLTTGQ